MNNFEIISQRHSYLQFQPLINYALVPKERRNNICYNLKVVLRNYTLESQYWNKRKTREQDLEI